MDWDDIFGDSSEQPTNPREIFGRLDKSPRFEFLRDVQADILDGWYGGPWRMMHSSLAWVSMSWRPMVSSANRSLRAFVCLIRVV
jgi:hypothetical protein